MKRATSLFSTCFALLGCQGTPEAAGQRSPGADRQAGEVVAAGQMREPRSAHSASRLADGRVLITGGYGVTPGSRGEAWIYRP